MHAGGGRRGPRPHGKRFLKMYQHVLLLWVGGRFHGIRAAKFMEKQREGPILCVCQFRISPLESGADGRSWSNFDSENKHLL